MSKSKARITSHSSGPADAGRLTPALCNFLLKLRMKDMSKLDNRLTSTLILVLLISIVVFLWFYVPGFMANGLENLSDKGAYGDSFGSVNALFTGLAFAGLIFTILLQQREIKLQRDDFAAQLTEMQATRAEVSRQASLTESEIEIGIANLKMKCLEIELKELEYQVAQWTESARNKHAAPKIEEIKKKAHEIVASIKQSL